MLTVNTSDWSITKETPFEFDTSKGLRPVLSKIDDTHYLCTYEASTGDLIAVVLIVDTGTWTITKGTPFMYDSDGELPELVRIDSTHHLCTYIRISDGEAVVLIVNTGDWSVSKGNTSVYSATLQHDSALEQIDSDHYLIIYSNGPPANGASKVLTVNPSTWDVSVETPLIFDYGSNVQQFDLIKIDATHYLAAYKGDLGKGSSMVLTVNTSDWTISGGTLFYFDPPLGSGMYPALSRINNNNFLCAYSDRNTADARGDATVLTVNTSDWTISGGSTFRFDTRCMKSDAVQVDTTHHLCVYQTAGSDGMAVIFEVASDGNDTPPIRP